MNLAWDHTLGLTTTDSAAISDQACFKVRNASAIDFEKEEALESLELGKFCGFTDITDSVISTQKHALKSNQLELV